MTILEGPLSPPEPAVEAWNAYVTVFISGIQAASKEEAETEIRSVLGGLDVSVVDVDVFPPNEDPDEADPDVKGDAIRNGDFL